MNKLLIIATLLLFLGSCAKKTSTTTTTQDTKQEEVKTVENKPEEKKEDTGLKPNISFVNTDETEITSNYTWAKVNYIYLITKDLRRADLYDVTIKKPFSGKDSGGHQTTFVTSISTIKADNKYTVKVRFAEKKSEYEWKPNPASYIDCVFDLKTGAITYNTVGTHWQKFQKSANIVKSLPSNNFSSKKAMSIAVEHIIANYNGAFVK
ncbi:MAG: hypothetical protein MUE81_01360 [Thermoflexibacter sp.]|jgi:hypothetical protein|nr:hypothetical protein [Thermoflexibacter sp.]